MELKMVILVRQDLALPKGKLAAQVAHAAVDACLSSTKAKRDDWLNEGQKKVVLKVADEKELLLLLGKSKSAGFNTSLIVDAGKTVVEPGTKTCGAIGPDDEQKIDAITGNLKML